MSRLAWSCAVAALACASAALAQQDRPSSREPGAIERTPVPTRPTILPDRPAKPPTAESEAWMTAQVQAGDWRLVRKDADGAIYAKPAGAVRPDGVVPMHLRIEYRNAFSAARHDLRSVQADLEVNCATHSMNGPVNGFEGQNLTGRKVFLEPGEITVSRPGAKVETEKPRYEGLRLLDSEIVREQCAEGHQYLAAKYGGAWRPLLADDKAVRLVSGPATYGLDRKLDLKFRIEAKEPQSAAEMKWRSAIADLKVDCAEAAFTADATLYSGADESGQSAKLVFDGYPGPGGTIRTKAPGAAPAPLTLPTPGEGGRGAGGGRGASGFSGFGGAAASADTGPGKTVVDLLRNGALVVGECDSAKAKLAAALATPGDPLRRQAETWASQNLNTKGFRLPTYLPEGVLMLSDEVVATPAGPRRAVVRAEFNRPVPTRDGMPMASRITVLEVDCATKKLRGISESTFAKNGAKELIREAANPQAQWTSIDEQPALGDYVEAVCATKPS